MAEFREAGREREEGREGTERVGRRKREALRTLHAGHREETQRRHSLPFISGKKGTCEATQRRGKGQGASVWAALDTEPKAQEKPGARGATGLGVEAPRAAEAGQGDTEETVNTGSEEEATDQERATEACGRRCPQNPRAELPAELRCPRGAAEGQGAGREANGTESRTQR